MLFAEDSSEYGAPWQMPQGGIDADEKPRRAVLRELKEETGTDRAEIIARSRDWYRYDLPEELRGRVWGGRYRGQESREEGDGRQGREEDSREENSHEENSHEEDGCEDDDEEDHRLAR